MTATITSSAARREIKSPRCAADWEYYTGSDGLDSKKWSGALSNAVPIFNAPKKCGTTAPCYVPSLGIYLMTVWYSPGKLPKWFEPDEMRCDFYQAEHPWGPWKFISGCSDKFLNPPGHMYGLNVCAKFQEQTADGARVWLFMSGCPFDDAPQGLYKFWGFPVILRTTPVPPSTLVNDDDPAIAYHGNWVASSQRNYFDYKNDVHYTTTPGDWLEYKFNGTGIEYIAEKSGEHGCVEVYLDGKKQNLNLQTTNFPRISQVVAFRAENLTAGMHTIKLVNQGPGCAMLDAFRIWEEVSSVKEPESANSANAGTPATSDSTITLQSLLQEMIHPDHLASWPNPSFVTYQASSHDRRAKTPADLIGWFGNHDCDQFERMESHDGRDEWVIMDAEGPGCIDRFWSAWNGRQVARSGTVRFYLDDKPVPAIETALYDLLVGKSFVAPPLAYETPRIAGNLYLPIPYAKHCKITYEETDQKNPQSHIQPHSRYWNIEYRTYPAGTRVQTFNIHDYEEQSDLVEKAARFLSGPWEPAAGVFVTLDREIAPGQEATLDLPVGSHAVRQLNFNIVNPDPGQIIAIHRATVLTARFDGEQTIWCPVSDFFGSGIGVNELNNWVCQVDKDGKMRTRWVMPYQNSASFTFHNFGKQKVTVHLEAVIGDWPWDERSMHFHCTWRDQTDIPTRPHSDWNYLTASGRGCHVGDTLSVYSPSNAWFGEGDEKIFVDHEAFPSHFGTGTEDYYGSAYSFPRLFQSSFSNLILKPQNGYIGESTVTRVRNLDAITFGNSLKFDMEIWHWADCKVDYTVANYWYGIPGATCATASQADAVIRPVK